jgi:hypothetical protein
MKKSFFVLAAAICIIVIFQAFTTANQPRWKNLHILPQNISEDNLDSIMHLFTASLNVKCSFCHVRNTETDKMDFPNDSKGEKLVARKMMIMSIDINKNHFQPMEDEWKKGEGQTITTIAAADSAQYMLKYVTCYTCHHGSAHPDKRPPKHEEPPKNPTPETKN